MNFLNDPDRDDASLRAQGWAGKQVGQGLGELVAPGREMGSSRILSALAFLFLLAAPFASHAQWLTQSIDLKPGWNAVFLHVDPSHDTLNASVAGDVGNPILEVWRWNPPSVAQFTDSPAEPAVAPEWTSWLRTDSGSTLQRLNGDSSYLVRVGTNVSNYTWRIKGRPVAPRHDWTISGLNLIGFPTVTNNPPKFSAFLAQAPELQSATPEIYYYPGGDLSSNNPAPTAWPLELDAFFPPRPRVCEALGTTYPDRRSPSCPAIFR